MPRHRPAGCHNVPHRYVRIGLKALARSRFGAWVSRPEVCEHPLARIGRSEHRPHVSGRARRCGENPVMEQFFATGTSCDRTVVASGRPGVGGYPRCKVLANRHSERRGPGGACGRCRHTRTVGRSLGPGGQRRPAERCMGTRFLISVWSSRPLSDRLTRPLVDRPTPVASPCGSSGDSATSR